MALHFFKKRKDTGKAEEGGKGKATERTGNLNAEEQQQPHSLADSEAQTSALATPLLDDEDEKFLERLVSSPADEDEGPRPPLPPRPRTPDLSWESDSDSLRLPSDSKAPSATTTASAPKKSNRLSRLFQRGKVEDSNQSLTVPDAVPKAEAEREWADLSRVLSRLGVTPTAGESESKVKTKSKALALSASDEVKSLVAQFLLILKDIAAGAPTAVDDLTALLDGRNDVLKRGFEKLPSSMQKLVTQLPKKLTTTLAPEILAAAAEAQGLGKNQDKDGKGLSSILSRNLGELALTPALIQSMFKAIVNALKVRWPAFAGTNVLWSAAAFLLLFVLWYCHKRGKEEREKREKGAESAEGGEGKEVMSSAVIVAEPSAEEASRA
ncbi:hypothetical protein N656DRAFT_715747 [Canariomyces notabilis]|uniref:Ring-like domain-containing protein n=1 Tax=Canariomyces notabilis TaxID=2074819 RepID=A0AAN6T9R0_9PEZI|nr:hypothetical protein N656DRAFT_715747 [Canariomyces arenarius]